MKPYLLVLVLLVVEGAVGQDTLDIGGGWHIKGVYRPDGQYLWMHYADRMEVDRVRVRDDWWCYCSRNYDLVTLRVDSVRGRILFMLIKPKHPDGRDYWAEAVRKFGSIKHNMPECAPGVKFWWSWDVYQFSLISRMDYEFLKRRIK